MSPTAQTTEIAHLADTHVADCYQCGKCSAGCPMAEQMDLLPNQLVRLVQLGRLDRALRSDAIWKRVSCLTCSTRCPKSVDCAAVMDGLRQLSVERGVASEARRRTVLFQQAFLENVRRNGRLCEFELIGVFKTKAFLGDRSIPLLLKDATLAPKMMKRGKFHFRGERVRDRGIVQRIFERCGADGTDTAGAHGTAENNGSPLSLQERARVRGS
jgi:heterodisulfide reductase subunit C2